MGFRNARQSVRAAIKTEKIDEKINISEITINYPRGKMMLNLRAIFDCLLIPKYKMQNIVNVICMDTKENSINNLEVLDIKFSLLELQLEQNPNLFNKRDIKYLENNHALIKKALF